MDLHQFEDRIKGLFDRHKPESDTDAIWKNIEPRLKKKKKRRFIFFLLGALTLGLLFFLFRPQNKSQAAWNANNSVAGKSSATGSGVIAPSQGNNLNSTTLPPVITAKLHPKIWDGGSASGAPSQPSDKAFPSNNHLPPVVIPALEPPTAAEHSAGDPATESRHGNTQPVQADKKQDVASTPAPKSPEVTQAPPKPLIPTVAKEASVQKKQEEEDKTAQKQHKKGKDKKKKNKSIWEQRISLEAGPALAFKKLTARTSNGSSSGLLGERISTEKSRMAASLDFMWWTVNQKGLALTAGLDYRQANEKFHLDKSGVEVNYVPGVISYTVDAFGNTIDQTIGMKKVTKTTVYSNTAYNRYHFVDLPIGIGYASTDKKSGWQIFGGIDLNVFFRANAVFIGPGNIATEYNYSNQSYSDAFKSNAGFGWWLAGGYYRKLTDRLRWQVSARLQAPFQSVSSASYELEQRYVNMGVQTGVSYFLNPKKKPTRKNSD
jgi:hypothetical protein